MLAGFTTPNGTVHRLVFSSCHPLWRVVVHNLLCGFLAHQVPLRVVCTPEARPRWPVRGWSGQASKEWARLVHEYACSVARTAGTWRVCGKDVTLPVEDQGLVKASLCVGPLERRGWSRGERVCVLWRLVCTMVVMSPTGAAQQQQHEEPTPQQQQQRDTGGAAKAEEDPEGPCLYSPFRRSLFPGVPPTLHFYTEGHQGEQAS